ncbi:MAG: 4-(cytidine 5'-diphospho)-2-C-methyl-D-erythritol kinase, partial [Candidatus Margulisiibacteriota bacterium]
MLLKLRAYAKINLSLKVLGKRADGYHEIESLMQSVSLSDYLTLEPVSSGIAIFTNDPSLAVDHRNLAFRAAELFFHRQKNCPIKGIKIYLQKCIPVAAGLAGGSADAAAVIWGLNQMMEEKERLSEEKLLALGAQIGSDVPFC